MQGGLIFDKTGVSLSDFTGTDLTYPLLILIILFWAFLALSGILTTVFTRTKARDAFKRFKSRIKETLHKRHSHQE